MPPAIAVLATWAVVTGWVLLLGSAAGALARPRVGSLGALRVALWFGFAVLVLLALIPNFFLPLVGGGELVILGIATVLAVVAWLVIRRRTRAGARARGWVRPGWWTAVPIAGLVLMLLLLAHHFAGPLTNYDSGLYHLNAIQFAAEYPTIPGLANLQDRLGTNVSSFNLGALLANTPWGLDAVRLLVGLFVFLLSTDLTLRLMDGRRRTLRLPGTYVLVLAVLLSVPFLLANPGYWVTSPTADTVAFVMTVVAGAYLADAVASRDTTWAAVALVTASLAASIRTQLWVFAFLVAAALLVLWWTDPGRRGRVRRRPRVLTLAGVLVSAVVLVTMMVRDVILSGWLLFPAGYLPLPVAWRVPDTTAVRDWLLSWARDPGASPEQALNGWYWLWPWVGRTLDDWAVRGALGLAALAVVALLALRRTSPPEAPRTRVAGWGWLLAVAPALGTLAIWFWTAPDPRFAWGALVLAGAVPAAFALRLVAVSIPAVPALRAPVPLALAAGFMAAAVLPPAVAGLTQVRGFVAEGYEYRTYAFGPVSVVASVNPVPVPAVEEFVLPSGQVVLVTVGGDQCWGTFPLCRPYADPNLRFRGSSVADGFTSAALDQL